MKKYIGERKLLYSLKSDNRQIEFLCRVSFPRFDEESLDDVAVCTIEFVGLDEPNHDVYGMDSLQAIALAVNIDPSLRRLSEKKYNFYWLTGEPYFDE